MVPPSSEPSGWPWPSSAVLAADFEHELLEIPEDRASVLADLPAEVLTDSDQQRGRLAALIVEAFVLGYGRAVGLRPGIGFG